MNYINLKYTSRTYFMSEWFGNPCNRLNLTESFLHFFNLLSILFLLWIFVRARSCVFNSFPFAFLRFLRDERAFSFIPRSRQELPDNFPKEIPGICYFLEAGKTPSHASLTSTRSAPIRKVSYDIGTMFLRETSLWDGPAHSLWHHIL